MAEPDQPKKETVRIELPHPTPVVDVTGESSFSSSLQSAPEDVPSTDLFPLPNHPVASRPLPGSVGPASVSPPSGPQTETVRNTLNPEPLRSPPRKAQSLIPQIVPKNPLSSLAAPDKTWMLLYWLLLGLSAFILIIQIWTYFS